MAIFNGYVSHYQRVSVASVVITRFGFLHRVRATLKRHEFRLDFTPTELNGSLLS